MRTLSSAVFYFPDCYDGLDGESFDAGELLHGSDGSKNAERVCVFLLNCGSDLVVLDRRLRQRWDGTASRRAGASR